MKAVKADTEETAWFSRHRSSIARCNTLASHLTVISCSGGSTSLPPTRTYDCWRSRSTERRWLHDSWEKRQEQALRDWLLDRLEDRRFWFDAQGRPLPRSVAQLADDVTRDTDLVSVLALWEGRPPMFR